MDCAVKDCHENSSPASRSCSGRPQLSPVKCPGRSCSPTGVKGDPEPIPRVKGNSMASPREKCASPNKQSTRAMNSIPMNKFAETLTHLETTPKSHSPQNKFSDMPHILSPVLNSNRDPPVRLNNGPIASPEHRAENSYQPDGCMGLSFSDLFIRHNKSVSQPKSPRTGRRPGTNSDVVIDSFNQMRTNVQQRVKTLRPMWQCSSSPAPNTSTSHDSRLFSFFESDTDRSPNSHAVSFSESGTFDDDIDIHRGLLQRMISWSTNGTSNTTDDSVVWSAKSPARYALEAKLAQGDHGPRNPVTAKRVKFQYPPITSLRLRPRTEIEEVENLFFVEDELDQIEDDRIDTEATDDVETLLSPGDWQMLPPACTSSSTISASVDEAEEADSPLSPVSIRGDASNTYDHGPSLSPPPHRNEQSSRRSKRIVQGVQILLREKSV